jgi:sodium transport system permease protein
MNQIWIILKKEIIDNLRDRRSLSSSILTPLVTPLLLIGLMVVMGRTIFMDPQEVTLRLPVSGAAYAPNLIAYLQQNNVVIADAPEDPRTAVREGDLDIVLLIPAAYEQKIRSGEPAPLQLVIDPSRQPSMVSIDRTRSLINQYASTITILRLQARGIDPQLLSPLAIESINVSTPQTQTLLFLNMMPFIIVLTIFVGGMYVIIDITAGEKERGSLEPLLTLPIRRWELLVAKLLASLPFALITLIVMLVVFGLAFNVLPLEDWVGMPLALDPQALVALFYLSLPIVLLASALQVLVATYTRSFKEAQTYLSFLPIVAGFPTAFLAFLSVRATIPIMIIPVFSQSVLINKILRQETMDSTHILISIIATVVISLLLVLVSIKLYEREQVLVGR